MARRVTLLRCSPRVAPGQLTLAAWDAVRSSPVATGDAGHPQVPALRAAGVAVTVCAAPRELPAGDLLWLGDAVPAWVGETAAVLEGSVDVPGARLLDAVAVMDRLRSPGGCPWDAEQTHASLAKYLLEEAYEAYQALEDGALTTELREELGDVLLQVLFHARIAQEPGGAGWDIDDVASDLVDKLVRRHPHVFAASRADTAGAVEANWDAIKAAEKQRTSVTEGVPLGQPALALAAKLVSRARKAGLPVELPDPGPDPGPDDLLGRALFGLAARAAREGLDPEAALRATARSFAAHVRARESAAGGSAPSGAGAPG